MTVYLVCVLKGNKIEVISRFYFHGEAKESLNAGQFIIEAWE
jgi:hypothetical protein